MSQCPSQEVLKLALDALENSIDLVSNDAREAELLYGKYQSRLAKVKGLVALEVAHGKAIAAIKEALAQPEQEPVAYYHPHKGFYWAKPTRISAPTAVDVKPLPLYTDSQQQWAGLTYEEVSEVIEMGLGVRDSIETALEKLQDKNSC